jgi:CubicO group peptidase (beta-lactamase class C family)
MRQRIRIAAVVAVLFPAGAAAVFGIRQASPPAAPADAVRPAAVDPSTAAKRIDDYMQAQAAVNGFSGSILLARDGRPILAKGYGFANVEWQISNTPQTKFRIGSITKPFTSMAVMQLQERGKLKVQDSICTHVSPCPDAWQPVTVHHLLTHTSGIPTYTGLPDFTKTMMMPATIEDVVARIRDLPFDFEPGSQFKYNNSGYFLLGVIIERAAGKKYEEVLREQIFGPVGMTDSGYDWSSRIVARRAAGYTGRGAGLSNAPPIDMQQPFSAGALYSTVEDLLKWDQALYTDTLLPAAAKAAMFTPFKESYAYGWGVREPAAATFGRRQIAHAGGINGFSSILIRIPDERLTLIVLANNDRAGAGPVSRDLLAIYYGQPYKVPS